MVHGEITHQWSGRSKFNLPEHVLNPSFDQKVDKSGLKLRYSTSEQTEYGQLLPFVRVLPHWMEALSCYD